MMLFLFCVFRDVSSKIQFVESQDSSAGPIPTSTLHLQRGLHMHRTANDFCVQVPPTILDAEENHQQVLHPISPTVLVWD